MTREKALMNAILVINYMQTYWSHIQIGLSCYTHTISVAMYLDGTLAAAEKVKEDVGDLVSSLSKMEIRYLKKVDSYTLNIEWDIK